MLGWTCGIYVTDVILPDKGWILACPRSGTRFVHDVLENLGVRAGYDSTAGGQPVEDLQVEVTSMGAWRRNAAAPDAPALWLIRHPLKVIASMLANAVLNPYRAVGRMELELAMRYAGANWEMNEIGRSLAFVSHTFRYLSSPLNIEDQHRFKIEEGPDEMRRALTHLDLEYDQDTFKLAYEAVPNTTNRVFIPFDIEWKALPAGRDRDELHDIAKYLGYD